jgi:hypothetical protein
MLNINFDNNVYFIKGDKPKVVGVQLSVQSVPITNNVVSSNPVHGELNSLQHYVKQFVSDLQQVGGFLLVLRFHPPIKL